MSTSENNDELFFTYLASQYFEEMSYEEFLIEIKKGNIKIENKASEDEGKSIKEKLIDSATRNIIKTHIEGDVLHIDITLGIDEIIGEISNCGAEHIIIYADNKDYDGLERLKELGKDIGIVYIHNEYRLQEPATIDSFLGMRDFINDIVKDIKAQQLTPVEEIMYLYTMIKWYKYNYDKTNYDNAQYIHSFIDTGEIVCAGYSKLFAQIAKELGYNAFVCLIGPEDFSSNSSVGHERNAIYIYDSHYDIHGLYYLDVTFDSSEIDAIGEKYGEDVQKYNLFFQCFLLNLSQYRCLFSSERNLITVEKTDKIVPFIQDSFRDINDESLIRDSKVIDLETIKRIFKNTMLKSRTNRVQIEEMLQKFDQHNQIQQRLLECNGYNSRGFRM